MTAPRWSRWLLAWLVPLERRDDALGDLEEAHRRRHQRMGRVLSWWSTSAEALMVGAAFILWRWRDRGWSIGRWVSRPDLRLSFRLMLKQPVQTITAFVALAVGIGLATAGFSFLNVVLFSRLPHESGDRVVRIRAFTQPEGRSALVDIERYSLFRSAATTFEYVGGMSGRELNVDLSDGRRVQSRVAEMTPAWLRYLPDAPFAGRLFVTDDGLPGAAPVAVVAERFWREQMAADPNTVGESIRIDDIARTIVGIAPDTLQFPVSPDLWLAVDETFLGGTADQPGPRVAVLGVLAPGTTLGTAQDQLQVLSDSVAAGLNDESGPRIEVTGFTDLGQIGDDLATAAVAGVLAILLVIGANIANLILARSFARHREFALRAALGASRARLVAQVFVEVLVVGSLAACVGALLASRLLSRFTQGVEEVPYWVDFRPSVEVMVMVAATTVLVSALASVFPALRATRRDLSGALTAGGGRGVDVRFGVMSSAMTAVQIALSVALIYGSIVFAQGYMNYFVRDLGLEEDHVLTAYLRWTTAPDGAPAVPPTGIPAIVAALEQLPGVEAVGAASAVPRLSPAAPRVVIDETDATETAVPRSAVRVLATPGHFRVLGVALRAGRLLQDRDVLDGALPVVVVDDTFARAFFGDASPIGRRMRVSGDALEPWHQIVGVVADHGMSAGHRELGSFYLPLRDADRLYLTARVAGEPLTYAEPVRQALGRLDPLLITGRIGPLSEVAHEDRTAFAAIGSGLMALGLITLMLSLAGVYALMSLAVTRRTREIGVRIALGATARGVTRAVVGRAAAQVAIGALVGAGLARLLLQARSVLVSRLDDGGPWALPVIMLLLVVAGIAAAWIPVRRALRIRPIDALRAD